MLLTASWLLTGATPPIKDGAVLIEGDLIRDIGTRSWFAKRDVADVVDLGDSILIPGLVNAHSHLEFAGLKGKIPPTSSFTEWVLQLLWLNHELSPEEKKDGIRQGIEALIRGGTTTLADHRSPSVGLIPTPFRESIFLEVGGVTEEKTREMLRLAEKLLQDDFQGQVSPHSFYSVPKPVLAELFSRFAGEFPLSIHTLENREEDDFFRVGSGPLYDLIHERSEGADYVDESPIVWLKKNDALSSRLMLIHGNHLTDEEIRLLRDSGASVIHCPGSHLYFDNTPFPLKSLVKTGIRVGLGTDSWASNESLSMLGQMRLMKRSFPDFGEEEILTMATQNGAIALGRGSEIGTIEVGKKADLVAVPLLRGDVDPYEALFLADEVNFSMVGGRMLKM